MISTAWTTAALAVAVAALAGGCGAGDEPDVSEGSTSALPAPRPLNGRPLPETVSGPVRLLVAGHLYGAPSPDAPTPADDFLTALPRLARTGSDLFVALGDVFKDDREASRRAMLDALRRLPMPVVNAPGNHDLIDRAGYERDFGPTYGALRLGAALLVVLDSELDPWNVSGEQLAFLRGQIERCRKDPTIRALLVFSHKLIFAHQRRYVVQLMHVNSLEGLTRRNDFTAVIEPLLAGVAREKAVWWFAGDVGCRPHSFNLFYDHDERTDVHYVACGISDSRDGDSVLQVDVTPDGAVRVEALPLATDDEVDLHSFGRDWWLRRFHPSGLPPAVTRFLDALESR